MPIRIEEPSPFGVIVPALEVVISGFVVVIISTVAEGVIEGHNLVFQYRIPVGSGQTAFSPCIIGICADLLPRAVVNPDDISLQILLKEEAIKYTGFIGTGSVFQANRRTGFIVEIIQQVFNS